MNTLVAVGTSFVKVHALGNDFIILDVDVFPHDASLIARTLCDRHRGIGADGCIFLVPSKEALVRMHICNADGTESAQCGNALRCVAHVLRARGTFVGDACAIETLGQGAQRVRWANGQAHVDMGRPIWDASRIPHAHDDVRGVRVVVEDATFVYDAVSFGNPHCVIVVADCGSIDVARYGALLSAHPHFPQRTNVEFVQIVRRDTLHVRVFERGVGETQACGSGACAAMATLYRAGVVDDDVVVTMPGGDMRICAEDGHIWQSGPAQTVFFGRWGA